MPDATSRDLRLALAVVHRLNEDDPGAETDALILLARLVGCDYATVTTNDHVARTMTAAASSRPGRNLFHDPDFSVAVAQHPAFAAYRTGTLPVGSSAALSDLRSLTALRRLPLYVDHYRPQGVVDQLLGVVAIAGRQATAVTLNRSRRGFARRDRELLDLVTPHLAQAATRRKRTVSSRTLARLDDRRPTTSALTTLTERERQVALLLAEGATDHEIGRGLAIAVRTVHKHVEHIYRKLDLTNRTTLAALVHRASHPPSPH